MTTISETQTPTSDHEFARLASLRAYQIVDTPPEEAFDRLTHMAAQRFSMPISLLSLADNDRLWFKSHFGTEVEQVPRENSFCSRVLQQNEVLVINDTTQDVRFSNNPMVAGAPGIRFYAGAPITTRQGTIIGALCIMDRQPRTDFNQDQKKELRELAAIAMDEIELRQSARRIKSDFEMLQAAQNALEEAHRAAEQSMQMKSQFVATVSHELRTPLNGILGMAYLLCDTPLNELQQEYIDTINHSAQNLLLLVNDVLDLSKIEARELILEKKPFDIKNNFAKTVKLLKPLAQKRNNVLFYYIDPTIPNLVISDPGRIAQIVTNLLGNAVKFTENGKVEISLLYDVTSSTIYCEVKDTGIGIAKSKHHVIFQRFSQGDASISEKFGGTGLGLAITKHLVIMLGGKIGFESEEKVGSRFWFSLPISRADESLFGNYSKILPRSRDGLIDAQQARVMVAEDNQVNQLFLVALLKKFGFTQIDVAENGLQVIELLNPNDRENQAPPYDAVFMDGKMPELDGYETTRRIRAMERDRKSAHRLPIIAMTAHALAGSREACFEAGMDEYLSKPLQPDLLKDVLRQWFKFPDKAPPTQTTTERRRSGSPPIDLSRLQLVAETNDEKSDVLALFFRLADQQVAEMETARRKDEFPRWKIAAHSLKGSAANMGMSMIEQSCLQAEKAASLSYEQRSSLLQQIRNDLDDVKAFLRKHQPALMRPEATQC